MKCCSRNSSGTFEVFFPSDSDSVSESVSDSDSSSVSILILSLILLLRGDEVQEKGETPSRLQILALAGCKTARIMQFMQGFLSRTRSRYIWAPVGSTIHPQVIHRFSTL